MAVNFYLKKGETAEIDIESYFGIRIMSVRGLEPPQPKDLHIRDWASQDGVDYYIPAAPATRKKKSSEVIMTIWIEDGLTSAQTKYRAFCDYLFDNGLLRYRDTLQGFYVNMIYNTNKPSWYQFVGTKQVMAEITFLNPSGLVTLYVP